MPTGKPCMPLDFASGVLVEMWVASVTGVVGPGRWKLPAGVGKRLAMEDDEPSLSILDEEAAEPGIVWPGAGDGGSECAVEMWPDECDCAMACS